MMSMAGTPCVRRLASLRSRLRMRKSPLSRRIVRCRGPLRLILRAAKRQSKDVRCCCRSTLAHDDMEEVPVLGLAVGRGGVGLLLFQHLDGEALQQTLDLTTRQMGDAGLALPFVALAEELAGKAPARRERALDFRPHAREALRRAER